MEVIKRRWYQTDSVAVIVAHWRDWMTVDMPYNAALYPNGQRPQTSLILAGTSQTRLSVPMRLIDLNLNASVATRLITLSPPFSRRLAAAAEQQMAVGMHQAMHNVVVDSIHAHFPSPDALLGACSLVEQAGI